MKKNAFTLIELLVVMTIISVILGLSTLAFQSSRQQARDTKRKADLEQIRSGLEIYRSDVGSYPLQSAFNPSNGLSCGSNNYLVSGTFSDPLSSTYSYTYVTAETALKGCGGALNSGSSTYTLCSHLEIAPSVALSPTSLCLSPTTCGSGATCNYEAVSP